MPSTLKEINIGAFQDNNIKNLVISTNTNIFTEDSDRVFDDSIEELYIHNYSDPMPLISKLYAYNSVKNLKKIVALNRKFTVAEFMAIKMFFLKKGHYVAISFDPEASITNESEENSFKKEVPDEISHILNRIAIITSLLDLKQKQVINAELETLKKEYDSEMTNFTSKSPFDSDIKLSLYFTKEEITGA